MKKKQKDAITPQIKAAESKARGVLSEFRAFIMRGNVIDLAVGVIIGAAFQSIVNSIVNDLIMPFVGLLTGSVNFTDQFVVLKYAEGDPVAAAGKTYTTLTQAKEAGATVFAYGSFITAVINFLILAVVIFFLVRGINRLQGLYHKDKGEEPAPAAPTTKTCPFCKSEIAIDATRCPHCTSELTE